MGEQPRKVIDELATYAYPPRSGVQADLVMKGGITSGVVYPLAVCELAKTYTFRNVGGSSAGGIAAAFTAAAEHARDGGGFQRLARVPQLLGGNLAELFQPSRGTRPLYEVFRSVKGRGGVLARTVRFLWYLVSRKVGASLLGAGFVLLCGLWVALLAGGAPHDLRDWRRIAVQLLPLLLVAVPAAFVAATAGTVRATLRELPRNGHGLFIGSRAGARGEGTPPFTDWMHEQLQVLVGRPGVLTFGDLWGPAARDAYAAADTSTAKGRENALRSIDPEVRLEMMTTNVTQRRPMRLPFVDNRLMLCPTELARWFPPDVLRHLVDNGAEATDSAGAPVPCPEHPGERLRHLPEPPDMPVVVAVRMTLSFPGLISAVPLWVVDYGHPDKPLARCWFSDGGISSNFPIHFFDALLPSRPTFAISLGPYPDGRENDHVHYPNPGDSSQPRVRPSGTLPQFFGAILDTMQNWSDVGQSMLPGYRDRIVEVRQRPHEGGMNLDMDEPTILGLAARGHAAALRLTRANDGFDFEKHREVRYELAMTQLQRSISRMVTYYDEPLPSGAPSYRDLVTNLAPAKVARTEALLTFGRALPPKKRTTWADFTVDPRRPEPDLRLVARF